ncbi:MAG: hypothetical protein WCB12_16115 [Bryobacteraceae bacterium]
MAKKLGCCFLLAPEIDGWIGIYPSSDQDEKVSREIHRRLKTEVVQLILHDSDVFCYFFYRDGRLADEFNSRPDYFGKVSDRKRRSQRGKPEELHGLLRDPADAGALRELLSSEAPEGSEDAFFHAHKMMEAFAGLLGLPNCVTSYNYLMGDDEGEGIDRRDEFVHVPDLSGEKGKRAAASAAASSELDRLRRDGVLLFSQSPAPVPPFPDPTGKGFIAWDLDHWVPERQLYRFAEPWSGGPTATGIVLKPGEWHVSVSPSGRFLVVSGESGTELRDFAENRRLFMAPTGIAAGFTPDERVLIISGEQIHLISIPGGEMIRSIPVRPCNRLFALHPSGSVLLADGGCNTLSAVDLSDGSVIRTFFIDKPSDFGFIAQLQRAFVVRAMEQHLLETARSLSERTGLPAVAPITAESPRRLRFSPDGRFLFCATNHGAWVYEWEALLASAEASPKPVYHFQPAQTPPKSQTPSGWWELTFGTGADRQVSDAVYDPGSNRLLLACWDACIQIDLGTRQERVLLTIPDAVPILSVGLSGGGGVLWTIESPKIRQMHLQMQALMGKNPVAAAAERDEPDTLRIWDYRKLQQA